MPIGSEISSPLPTSGDTNWSAELNTLLQEIIDILEARVTVDGLSISGTLDVQGATLSNIGVFKHILVADPNVAKSMFLKSDGEWYLRDGANNLIQLTATGSINVGTIAGIGGDYSSSGASVTYDSASGVYQFLMHTGDAGKLNVGDLRIRQGNDANYIAIKAPASLAADYNVNLPAATPQGIGYLTMDATGSVNVRISSSFTEFLDVASGIASAGSPTYGLTGWNWTLAGQRVQIAIPYTAGDRIDSIGVGVSATGELTATLYHRGQGAVSMIARVGFNDSGAGFRMIQNGTPTMTGTFPYTPPGTGSLVLEFGPSNTSPGFLVDSIKVTKRKTMLPGG